MKRRRSRIVGETSASVPKLLSLSVLNVKEEEVMRARETCKR